MTHNAASIRKKPDWDHALARYIAAVAQNPCFIYGVQDCCLFANGAIIAMTGADMMTPFRGHYTDDASIKNLVAAHDAPSLTSLIKRVLHDAGFIRKDKNFATRGDIALLDMGAMGVVGLDARHVVALTADGTLTRQSMDQIHTIWGVA